MPPTGETRSQRLSKREIMQRASELRRRYGSTAANKCPFDPTCPLLLLLLLLLLLFSTTLTLPPSLPKSDSDNVHGSSLPFWYRKMTWRTRANRLDSVPGRYSHRSIVLAITATVSQQVRQTQHELLLCFHQLCHMLCKLLFRQFHVFVQNPKLQFLDLVCARLWR